MTEFNSEVKIIPYPPGNVYRTLSDLSNLEKIRHLIPAGTASDVSCDCDSCTFTIAPVGKQTLRIVDREENETIKLTADKSPVEFFLWVQLKASEWEPEITKMNLTVRAELNPFLKAMAEKHIREGIEKLAIIIASIPYSS